MILLGVTIRSDMKWSSNTNYIVARASKKLWMIRRLKSLGADTDQLVDMFIKHCRSILELAVPAWHRAITVAEKQDIERIQKVALHIILGEEYETYKNALNVTGLKSLDARREGLCLKFARKAERSDKFKLWFRPKPKTCTRQTNYKYCKAIARTGRLENSPISYLANLLNEYYK